MLKSLRFGVLMVAAAAIPSAQVASAAPPAHAADKSVRSNSAQIRTSVNKLLGWRVGISSNVFRSRTFFSSATLADALGLADIEGNSDQKVSLQIDKIWITTFRLMILPAVKQRLDDLGLKMRAYRVQSIPSDDESSRKLFAFAKEMGVATIITNTAPSSLSAVDKLAGDNGVDVAIESTGNPKSVMSAIGILSPHIGVSVNFGDWLEQGIRPVDGLAAIKDRLMAVSLRDRSDFGVFGRDVQLGTGVANVQKFLYRVAQMEPPPQEQPNACSRLQPSLWRH